MTKLEKLGERLPAELDAGLILSGINRRYYTGFPSSAGILLVAREKSWFLIDFRYYEHAKARITDCEVLLLENEAKQLGEIFARHNIQTVGVEAEQMTLEQYRRYQERFPSVAFDGGSGLQALIAEDRLCKAEEEIQAVIAAQEIAERAFDETLNFIQAGRTEREIALYLDYTMQKLGAEALSFDTIVASGRNSAVPHAVPTEKPVVAGDFIVIDFGAMIGGYHSDMTRTVAVGAVSGEQKRVYDTVLKAQRAALDAVKAGVLCQGIDLAARRLIDNAGYAGCFGHSTGHGIGMEIHEAPTVSPKGDVVAKAGMLFSVEPGIYLEGRFGVRIEDMVVVEENGYRNLTKTKKDLISL